MDSSVSRTRGAPGGVTAREGIITGLIGAAVVAGWFLVLDMVVGRLLFTPAALGSALFLGAESPEAVQITASTVLGYTVIHVLGFVAIGVIFATMVTRAEENPSLLMALVLLFVTALTLSIGAMAILASWVLAELTWWGIAIGNLLAAVAMALFLWKRHPRLGRELPEAEERAAAEDGTSGPGWRGSEQRGPTGPDEEPHYRPRGPGTPEGGAPAG
jgi:CRP-like cAMP-binding protein